MSKRKVLFVGSFKSKSKTGGVGGQMYACTSLINSDLSNHTEWVTIDTTADTNLKIPTWKKLNKVSRRFILFFKYLIFNKFDYVLIFSSNGLSFLEKGYMAIIAKKFTKAKVIFAPRSGRLLNEIKSSKIKLIKRVFNHSDTIICQGNSWKEVFLEEVNLDQKKYVVQKNWINIKGYTTSKTKIDDRINILFLGWLEKDKGIFDLIDAADYFVQNNITNFIFNVAGKGKDEEQFIGQIAKKGLKDYFNIKGWVLGQEKQKLFEENTIFVLPSYFEGMPNSLLESMASGLACVASNVGSIGDVINNTNGLIFDRNNPQEFIQQLKKLVSDQQLVIDMSKQARRYIETEHSIENAVNNFRQNILN